MTDERKQRMLRQRGVSAASTMPKKSQQLTKRLTKTATPRTVASGAAMLKKKSIKKKEYR